MHVDSKNCRGTSPLSGLQFFETLKERLTNTISEEYAKAIMSKARKLQNISSYFAIFDPAEEGGYNVSFPDFPGCVTFGNTFEEAKKKAGEVLELWLEELADQRQEIPSRTARPIIDEIRVSLPS
jgi:predicted RNase H-like HicB family nuclease